MKKEENFIRALSDVDESIIAEAAAARLAPKKNNRLIVFSLAACLALIVGMAFVLLMGSRETSVPTVPATSTGTTSASTGPIINSPQTTPSDNTVPAPITTNDNPYSELISALKDAPSNNTACVTAPPWKSYTVTPYDDLNKNTNEAAKVFSGSYTTADGKNRFSVERIYNQGFYTRIICQGVEKKSCTYTIKGDSGIVWTNGAIATEDTVFLIAQYTLGHDTDWKLPHTYLPTLDTGKGAKILPIEDIFYQRERLGQTFTTVLAIDIDTFDVRGVCAWLFDAHRVYVTENNLYLYSINNHLNSFTTIVAINHKENIISPVGSIRLNGTLEDSYCLNEENGILRVVTNREPQHHLHPPTVYLPDGTTMPFKEPDNVLYCLSAEDLSVVAKVEDFYEFENEYPFLNVGFDGNDVYVCPKADLVSPVIHFDLSDLNNITYETVEYPLAYSRYLKEIGDGLYFTVRYTDIYTKLVEVVKLEENGFASVAEYAFSTEDFIVLEYTFDTENKIIQMIGEKNSQPVTITVQFDGIGLKEIAEQE